MFLTLTNNSLKIALPAIEIKEIISYTEIVKVPSDKSIEGVINLRGSIIPIFTLENHRPKKGVFVIIEKNNSSFGYWVDEVNSMISSEYEIQELIMAGNLNKFIKTKEIVYSLISLEDLRTNKSA